MNNPSLLANSLTNRDRIMELRQLVAAGKATPEDIQELNTLLGEVSGLQTKASETPTTLPTLPAIGNSTSTGAGTSANKVDGMGSPNKLDLKTAAALSPLAGALVKMGTDQIAENSGSEAVKIGGNALAAGAQGAAAGTMVAPGIGTAIGAGVGIVTSVTKDLIANHKMKKARQKEEQRLNYEKDSMGNAIATSDAVAQSYNTKAVPTGKGILDEINSNYDSAKKKIRSMYSFTGAQSMKGGGTVVGPGGPKDDKVKTTLPVGSFVVPAENAPVAQMLRDKLLEAKSAPESTVTNPVVLPVGGLMQPVVNNLRNPMMAVQDVEGGAFPGMYQTMVERFPHLAGRPWNEVYQEYLKFSRNADRKEGKRTDTEMEYQRRKKSEVLNMAEGGSVEVPVNLSNGEHVFTPQERRMLESYGIDIEKLAPKAKTGGKNFRDGGTPTADDKLQEYMDNPYIRAYLYTISDHFEANVEGDKTKAENPNRAGDGSYAYGRWQFIESTGKAIAEKYGIKNPYEKDSTETDQYKAAVALLVDQGVADKIASGDQDQIQEATAKLARNRQWTSLPGSTETAAQMKKRGMTAEEYNKFFYEKYNEALDQTPETKTTKTVTKAPGKTNWDNPTWIMGQAPNNKRYSKEENEVINQWGAKWMPLLEKEETASGKGSKEYMALYTQANSDLNAMLKGKNFGGPDVIGSILTADFGSLTTGAGKNMMEAFNDAFRKGQGLPMLQLTNLVNSSMERALYKIQADAKLKQANGEKLTPYEQKLLSSPTAIETEIQAYRNKTSKVIAEQSQSKLHTGEGGVYSAHRDMGANFDQLKEEAASRYQFTKQKQAEYAKVKAKSGTPTIVEETTPAPQTKKIDTSKVTYDPSVQDATAEVLPMTTVGMESVQVPLQVKTGRTRVNENGLTIPEYRTDDPYADLTLAPNNDTFYASKTPAGEPKKDGIDDATALGVLQASMGLVNAQDFGNKADNAITNMPIDMIPSTLLADYEQARAELGLAKARARTGLDTATKAAAEADIENAYRTNVSQAGNSGSVAASRLGVADKYDALVKLAMADNTAKTSAQAAAESVAQRENALGAQIANYKRMLYEDIRQKHMMQFQRYAAGEAAAGAVLDAGVSNIIQRLATKDILANHPNQPINLTYGG